VLLVIALCSCHGHYPTLLTQADSLILRGKYQEADSLLAVYDRHASNSKHDQMYRQLLQMERKFVDGTLSSNDFLIVDSLCRYYDQREAQYEHASSLCLLGYVYYNSGDYPSALNTYQEANRMAEEQKNNYLSGWLYQKMGDVFFDQSMLQECTSYYRKYYDTAVNNHDTLRMALAAFRMGRVYTIYNKVDSTIYYYRKSIEYGHTTSYPENIVPHAKSALSDIYIQIKEYGKASKFMTRDSIDDANWAYWHLGQNHVDSALWYLERIHGRFGVYGERETCLNIAQILESKGDVSKALFYYKMLPSIEDSIRVKSQIDETRRTQAQFNLNQVRHERDIAQNQSTIRGFIIGITFLITLMTSAIVYLTWRKYRNQKEQELTQGRLLLQEMERQNKQSAAQIERNIQQITLLNQQLQEARNNNDNVKAEKFQLEARLLDAENKQIQTKLQYKQEMQRELEHSPLRERIKLNAGKEYFQLKDEEWLQLATLIDNANDQFTKRLRNLYDNITEYELHICYLVKLDIPSVAIGTMLYKSKAAIGMARKRLYKKLTGKDGTAKDFNEFIKAF